MRPDILPHHQETIDNLTREYQHDERFLGLIIGGSVAKGCARADSDVDFMIIATDEEYQRRIRINDLFINRTDLSTYDGGFVDGKIIDLNYLKAVAEKGNDPTRAAFDGAMIPFSRIDNLEALIHDITRYPEEERDKRIHSFYCMSFIQHWLMGEAERHKNLYTMTRAASQLSLFAARLLLAENRRFFPYHKWMMHYLESCPEKPQNIIQQINQLLKDPSAQHATSLFENVKHFRDWGITDLEAFGWFMREVEWSWIDGEPPLEDW